MWCDNCGVGCCMICFLLFSVLIQECVFYFQLKSLQLLTLAEKKKYITWLHVGLIMKWLCMFNSVYVSIVLNEMNVFFFRSLIQRSLLHTYILLWIFFLFWLSITFSEKKNSLTWCTVTTETIILHSKYTNKSINSTKMLMHLLNEVCVH